MPLLLRLEVGVAAPVGAPAVGVDLLDGVEQMPGPVGAVERHRARSSRRSGASRTTPESARTYGSPSSVREQAVGVGAGSASSVGPGPGAVPSRLVDVLDRAVPELGQVLAVRVRDRLAEVGRPAAPCACVDPVERLRQVVAELVATPVDPDRHRDLAGEHPAEQRARARAPRRRAARRQRDQEHERRARRREQRRAGASWVVQCR